MRPESRTCRGAWGGGRLVRLGRAVQQAAGDRDDPAHAIVKMYAFGNVPFDTGVLEHRQVGVVKTFWRRGKERYAIRTGSYKIRDGYARERGFANVEPRVPMVILMPGPERRVLVFPDIRDGVEVLRALSAL
jgi:hypothetical protein